MPNFDDYDYKNNNKVISLNIKQIREKKLYPWEISSFLGRFNTYYYKAEVINTIAIALSRDINPEDIVIFNESFNLYKQNSNLSYLSLVDSDIKHLYFIGLPYSLIPNKKIFFLNRLFYYFRKINEFIYKEARKRLKRDLLGELYSNYNSSNNFDSLIEYLKILINECLDGVYLERSQNEILNSIYDDFINDFNSYQNEEDSIEIIKTKVLNNNLTQIDIESNIYKKYFKDFYHYLNNIQRPLVVVKNQNSEILTILCRGQLNKDEIKSSTLDLKSISHNSPFKAIINGGTELFRLFLPGNRIEEIERKEELLETLNNELENINDENEINEISTKIFKIEREKQTLIDIDDVERTTNVNNINNVQQNDIKSKLIEEQSNNQRKASKLLSDSNFEADLIETEVREFGYDIDIAV